VPNIDRSHLTVLWLFAGVVIFLAWAGILGQLLLDTRRRGVRAAIALLGLAGLFHPAAAVGVFDLVREGRKTEDPDLRLAPWTVGASALLPASSLVATVVAWQLAGAS
jgi:hypothetical protein